MKRLSSVDALGVLAALTTLISCPPSVPYGPSEGCAMCAGIERASAERAAREAHQAQRRAMGESRPPRSK